jgi:pyruvate ferredoxin oxidoreductase alpha subunit
MASGSAASTVLHTVRNLRKAGRKAGLLRIRQLRPFPEAELLSLLRPEVSYGVLDRNLSPGTGGVFTQEIRAILNRNGRQDRVGEFVAGLGGRDITAENIELIFDRLADGETDKSVIQWIGLKKFS